MSPKTFTHTWTQTRLETLQDQFRYLLLFGGIAESKVEQIVDGVAKKMIAAVGVFACDSSGLRVVEVELRVDWKKHGQLTLQVPEIVGDLPGWKDRQSPEIRIAGRRLAEIARDQQLRVNYWLRFVPKIRKDPTEYARTRRAYGVTSTTPNWKGGGFDERGEALLDVGEAVVVVRRTND